MRPIFSVNFAFGQRTRTISSRVNYYNQNPTYKMSDYFINVKEKYEPDQHCLIRSLFTTVNKT